MLIKGVDRVPVTVYNRVGDNYVRTVIKDCIWRNSPEVSFKSQGALPLDSIKLYIPNYEGYVSAKDYDGLYGWTITVGSEKNNTYIVEGVCDFIFNATNNKELSNQVREFEKNYNYHRANAIKENFIGGRHMRHLKVIC